MLLEWEACSGDYGMVLAVFFTKSVLPVLMCMSLLENATKRDSAEG